MAMQTGAATMASIMEVPQKLKVKLPYDPAIHFWTFIQRKQMPTKKDICTTMFIAALFTIAKT